MHLLAVQNARWADYTLHTVGFINSVTTSVSDKSGKILDFHILFRFITSKFSLSPLLSRSIRMDLMKSGTATNSTE
jgi:hypothetical protein